MRKNQQGAEGRANATALRVDLYRGLTHCHRDRKTHWNGYPASLSRNRPKGGATQMAR